MSAPADRVAYCRVMLGFEVDRARLFRRRQQRDRAHSALLRARAYRAELRALSRPEARRG